MTNQLQPPLSYHIDPTIYAGRPADSSGRLPKELRTYDLLDSLHISYERVDHDALPTIEACRQVDEILGTPMCKNLFLRNAQKTAFYLLLLPGEKKFKTAAPVQADWKRPPVLWRTGIYGTADGSDSRFGYGSGAYE